MKKFLYFAQLFFSICGLFVGFLALCLGIKTGILAVTGNVFWIYAATKTYMMY